MGNLIKICFSSPTCSFSRISFFAPAVKNSGIIWLQAPALKPTPILTVTYKKVPSACPILLLSDSLYNHSVNNIFKKAISPKEIWLSIPFGPQTKDLSVGTQVISNMNDSIPVSSHFQQDPSYQYSSSSHCLMCSVQSPRFRESWRCI